MRSILLVLSAAISGVIGGMGMGGGTLLIPILTLLFKINQSFSQTINLVAFIPMAVVALIIHFKNGVIKTKGLGVIIITALVFSVAGSLLAKEVSGDLQTKLFGAFLIALSVVQFITVFKGKEASDSNDE